MSWRKGQVALFAVASLGSGAVAAWSGVGGHTIAGVAWTVAGVAWAVAALDCARRLQSPTAFPAGPAEARPDHRGAPSADAIDRLVEPGEHPREWTIAADTNQGAVHRGALLLSDRALYCTFETGPHRERRTARIPIGAISDISRLPPRRLRIRYRTPNGDTRSILVDLPPREDADGLVRALVEARRAEAVRPTVQGVGGR